MSDSLIAEHDRMEAWQAKVDQLGDAEKKHAQRMDRKLKPYRKAMEAWRQEQAQALLDGKEPPEEPEAPKVSDAENFAGHEFMRRRQELLQERKTLLVRIAPDVLDDARTIEARELEWLRNHGHVTDLPKTTTELNGLIADVTEVQRAVDPTADVPKRVGIEEVARAALTEGSSLLAIPEQVETPTGIVQRAVDPVNLGPEGSSFRYAAPEPGPKGKPQYERQRRVSNRGVEI
jgi:hypothetical protein